MAFSQCYWLALAVLLLRHFAAVAAFFGKSRLPLKEDADEDIHQLKPGCIFGGEFYELEQKWHPVLDSEIMYCTQCTCSPSVIRGQTQHNGSVSCKRIANECPDVSKCAETPVLPPNSCCKVCPESGEYYALLTGSFSRDSLSDAVAAVHLSLQKTVMHVTLDVTRNVEPRSVRIVDELHRGRILFEYHVTRDGPGAKVCSMWLSAFEHQNALKSPRRLSVVLTTRAHPTGELKGIVERLPVASPTHTPFLGLLMAPSLAGYGGVVWIGVSHSGERAQMHVHGAVDIAGDEGSPATLTVELLRDETTFEKVVIATMPDAVRYKFNHVSHETTRPTLKRLAQGRVSVAVQTKSGRRLTATLKAWHPCGTMLALLNGMDTTLTNLEPGSAGLAKITLMENGSMNYQVQLHKFDRRLLAGVVAETTRPSGAVSKAIRLPMDGGTSGNGSTVTGTYEFADARELQLFVEGRTFLAVEIRDQPGGALRGQLQLVSHGLQAGSRDVMETMILTAPKMSLSAASICGITKDCFVYCKTVVPSLALSGNSSSVDLYMESFKHKLLIASWEGGVTVAASLISQRDMKEMATPRPIFRVVARGSNATGQLSLSQSCTTGKSREMEDAPSSDDGTSIWPMATTKSTAASSSDVGCSHEGQLYDDGDTWRPRATGDGRSTPTEAECSMCSCKRNQVECHRELCPPWSCPHPIRLPGECCPVCNSTNGLGSSLAALGVPPLAPARRCFFPGDKRHHAVGTAWHPYIPPLGFFACAVCFCTNDGSGYDCKQLVCPALPCPHHLAERRNESDCCKVCPARWYQGSSMLPAMAGSTGLVPENGHSGASVSSSGGGGGGSSTGTGLSLSGEPCVSSGRGSSTERLHRRPGAGGLECLLCTCNDNVTNCIKAKCNCRRSATGQSDCCRKLCTLSLQGPVQTAERKLRRLAASLPLQSGGGGGA